MMTKLKHISLIFIVLTITGCSLGQLKEPPPDQRPGAIGVTFYFIQTNKKGEHSLFDNTQLTEVYLSEMDAKGKVVKHLNYADIEQVITGRSQVAISNLDPKKRYALRFIEFDQKQNNITTHYSAELNPEQTYKELPIRVKDGQLTFAGVATFQRIKTSKGSDTRIKRGTKILADMKATGLWAGYVIWAKQDVFGYDKDKPETEKTAETFFYKNMEASQKSSYWKELAARALK